MDMLQKIDIHFWGEDLPFYFKRPSVRKTREMETALNEVTNIDIENSTDEEKISRIDKQMKACVDFINNTLVIGRDRQVKACSIIFGTDDYEMYDISEVVDIITQVATYIKNNDTYKTEDTDNLILNS